MSSVIKRAPLNVSEIVLFNKSLVLSRVAACEAASLHLQQLAGLNVVPACSGGNHTQYVCI